jgi:hypothetical protein
MVNYANQGLKCNNTVSIKRTGSATQFNPMARLWEKNSE